MTLEKAGKNKEFTIVKLNNNDIIKRRLMDMEITKGTKIKVIKNVPIGDSIEIEVKGYNLTLRRTIQNLLK